MIFVSYQSHSHPAGFNNGRRDVFILDNRIWKPYAPNIIPKIVMSLFMSLKGFPCLLVLYPCAQEG